MKNSDNLKAQALGKDLIKTPLKKKKAASMESCWDTLARITINKDGPLGNIGSDLGYGLLLLVESHRLIVGALRELGSLKPKETGRVGKRMPNKRI